MARHGQIVMFLIGMLLFSNAYAEQAGKPFSATAVQLTPGGAIQTKVYISKDAVRNEYRQNDQQVIEIIYPGENRRVLLFPREKAYMEQLAPAAPGKRAAGKDSPCADLPGTVCRVIGEEKINGIDTEKWEFSRVEQGRTVQSIHWVNKQRQLPVREFFPDGSIIEMHLLGKETINKRHAEKWRRQIMRATGERSQFFQWYDPELKLVIREEHPDGYVRELRDIKTGAPNKSLFSIPEGYERKAQPPQQAQSAPARNGAAQAGH